MYKNKILYVVLVLVLTPIVLILNYKIGSKSVELHNDSKNRFNDESVVDYENDFKDEDINDTINRYLLNNITGKLCCEEIGGIISGSFCIFEDLDGNELKINYRYLEDYDGKNYCTDEYFDRK